MSNFWDEYKKRAIYGDALGPPRNATEMGAANLAKHGKEPGYSGGGAAQTYDLNFRFPIRRILLQFAAGLLLGGVTFAVKYVFPHSILQYVAWAPMLASSILLLLSAVQLAVNIFNAILCRLYNILRIRSLRYGLFAGIAGYLIGGIFFGNAMLSFMGGFIPAAVAGFFWGHRRK
jgi:hypothetical protein